MNFTLREWVVLSLMIGIASYGFGISWTGWWIVNILTIAILTFKWRG